jgi:quinol monooxygenase YgiN
MVRLNVALSAASQRDAQSLLDACRFLMMSTRFDAGCVECSVWLEAETTVRYTEVWSTEADIRRRVQSDHFTSLLGVLESATEARVQFDFVTATRGLDYIAEVREQMGHES